VSGPGVLSRRALLESGPLLAGAAALPSVLGGCAPAADTGEAAPEAPPAIFMEAAKAATGGLAVDAALAARLYADLRAHDAGLDGKLPRLTAALRASGGDGTALLADAGLKTLFADLAGGLYLGVTGPQPARRCVGFETIESYALFAGVLAPPSYAGGEPGSWAAPAPSDLSHSKTTGAA
jgi:hypothetical protein